MTNLAHFVTNNHIKLHQLLNITLPNRLLIFNILQHTLNLNYNSRLMYHVITNNKSITLYNIY